MIELVRLDAQQTAAVTIPSIAPGAVAAALGGALPEVTAHLERHDVPLAGPPYARGHDRGDGTIDLEAGIPVGRAFPPDPTGTVVSSSLPAGEALRVERVGGMPATAEALAACASWLAVQRRVAAGPWWEVYLDDPNATAPEAVRTVLLVPVS